MSTSTLKRIDPLDRAHDPGQWPVGLFLHTWKGEELVHQGLVRSVDSAGKLWVQLFSFWDGNPTRVEAVDPAVTTITFYATNGDMLDAADAYAYQHDPRSKCRVGDGRKYVKFLRGT